MSLVISRPRMRLFWVKYQDPDGHDKWQKVESIQVEFAEQDTRELDLLFMTSTLRGLAVPTPYFYFEVFT